MGSRLEMKKEKYGICPETPINQGHLRRIVDILKKEDICHMGRKVEKAQMRKERLQLELKESQFNRALSKVLVGGNELTLEDALFVSRHIHEHSNGNADLGDAVRNRISNCKEVLYEKH